MKSKKFKSYRLLHDVLYISKYLIFGITRALQKVIVIICFQNFGDIKKRRIERRKAWFNFWFILFWLFLRTNSTDYIIYMHSWEVEWFICWLCHVRRISWIIIKLLRRHDVERSIRGNIAENKFFTMCLTLLLFKYYALFYQWNCCGCCHRSSSLVLYEEKELIDYKQ